MAYDPCSLLPDTHIPAGLVAAHRHAAYQVVGRIHPRIPRPPRYILLKHPGHTGAGCEIQSAILPPSGAAAAISLLAGGGSLLAGGVTFALVTKHPRHKGHGKTPTIVPEPSSAALFIVAILACLLARACGKIQAGSKSLLF